LVDEKIYLFLKEFEKLGLIINKGKIIYISFVEVPKQRYVKEENYQIKKGETSKLFD
jgi:hypothetical protein